MQLSGIRILVADDVEDNRQLIERFLQLNGAIVDLVHNGAEAVEKALQNDYDIILMDIQMPVLDGYSATIQLRDKGYNKPIVALTAHAMNEERERCLQIGCSDHVAKPISLKGLVMTVAKHVKSQAANPL